MRAETQNIREKLEHLIRQRTQHQENLNTVIALLEKADRRRIAEPDNVHRWNKVLDNLESCLDEAKAKLEGCELAINRLEREIQQQETTDAKKAFLPVSSPDLSREEVDLLEGVGLFSAASMEAAKRILSMSLEDVSKLTLEEVALLHSQIADENSQAGGVLPVQLAGRLELANQIQAEESAKPASEASPAERRQQAILRSAIDKISTNQLHTLTEEEIRLIISSYELLTSRLTVGPKDERLKRILGAAVNVLINRKRQEDRRKQQQEGQ